MRLSEIKAGVVGVGFIGVAHVEALRRLGVNVVGVVGSTPERAAAKAEVANLPAVYDDVEALAADPGVGLAWLLKGRALLAQAMVALVLDDVGAGEQVPEMDVTDVVGSGERQDLAVADESAEPEQPTDKHRARQHLEGKVGQPQHGEKYRLRRLVVALDIVELGNKLEQSRNGQ